MKRASRTVAPGWSERGSDTTGSDQTGGAPHARIVSDVFHGGKQAARLSTDQETEQVSLIQSALPGAFAGKRIRFSGYMKTEMAKGRAMFSIQAEDANGNRIAFDRMIGRHVRGKTDWTRYDIVMDIPRETRFFFYHPMIVGTGTAWFDDLSIEAVDPSTQLTTPDNGAGTIGTLSKRTGKQKQNLDRGASSALAAPLNLDFEREP